MSTFRIDDEELEFEDDTPDLPEESIAERLEKELIDLLSADREEKPFPLVSDMSDRFPDDTDVLRVELRRVHNPASGPVSHNKRVIEDAYVIGFMPESDLPEEGEVFQMHYHNYDGVLKFGHLSSFEKIFDVVQDGDNYFFSNTDANWRLSILTVGN